MKVTVRKIEGSWNGVYRTRRVYEVGGSEYINPQEALRAIFGEHGKIYRFLGIPEEAVKLYDLHPDDSDFSSGCTGWGTFVRCSGRSAEEILRHVTGEDGYEPTFPTITTQERVVEIDPGD